MKALAAVSIVALLVVCTHVHADILFQDDFDDGIVDPRYSPLGGAQLRELGGVLETSIFNTFDGVNMDVSDFSGAACYFFNMSGAPGIADGDSLLFTIFSEVRWSGVVFPFIELGFTKVGDASDTIIELVVRNTRGEVILRTRSLFPDVDFSGDPWEIRIDWTEDRLGRDKIIVEAKKPGQWFFRDQRTIRPEQLGLIGNIHDLLQDKKVTITGLLSGADLFGAHTPVAQWDSVTISTVHVPTPATITLVALAGLVGTRRRRRR